LSHDPYIELVERVKFIRMLIAMKNES